MHPVEDAPIPSTGGGADESDEGLEEAKADCDEADERVRVAVESLAHPLDLEDDEDKGIDIDFIQIDELAKFNCDNNTYKVVKKLKEALNQFLAYKAANPGCTDWSQKTREGALLTAIVKLLTTEVKVISAEPIENE